MKRDQRGLRADVPACEFVVRFDAAQTGRELTQSGGRLRKEGAEFVHIIEENSQDALLHQKSVFEAQNQEIAMSQIEALRI